MIQRVTEQAGLSGAAGVYVATDDTRVADAVRGFGGQVVMTDDSHTTGTDRIHEAATLLGLSKDAVVVNVQGDEPLIPPAAIRQVAALVSDSVSMATLCEEILDPSELFNPNVVKVVFNKLGQAVYFSRAPVPWHREKFAALTPQSAPDQYLLDSLEPGLWYRHLGIYAYTIEMLSRFVSWPASTLEQVESLEQLRVIANGESIGIGVSEEQVPPGIDVPEDVAPVLEAIDRSESQ